MKQSHVMSHTHCFSDHGDIINICPPMKPDVLINASSSPESCIVTVLSKLYDSFPQRVGTFQIIT